MPPAVTLRVFAKTRCQWGPWLLGLHRCVVSRFTWPDCQGGSTLMWPDCQADCKARGSLQTLTRSSLSPSSAAPVGKLSDNQLMGCDSCKLDLRRITGAARAEVSTVPYNLLPTCFFLQCQSLSQKSSALNIPQCSGHIFPRNRAPTTSHWEQRVLSTSRHLTLHYRPLLRSFTLFWKFGCIYRGWDL